MSGVIGTFLFAGLILFVFAVLMFSIFAAMRRNTPAHPSCGRCGYAVAGLTTLRCPECGSDLREVGIRTPAAARATPRAAWAILFTMLLFVAALITTGILSGGLPRYELTRWQTRLADPPSKTFNSIHLEAVSRHQLGGPLAPVLTAHLIHLDGRAAPTIQFDPRSDELRERAPGASRATVLGPLDASTVEQWFANAGLPIDDPLVRAEAVEIARQLRMLSTGSTALRTGLFSSGTTGSSTTSSPNRWFIGSLFFWLPVWFTGLWLILRKR